MVLEVGTVCHHHAASAMSSLLPSVQSIPTSSVSFLVHRVVGGLPFPQATPAERCRLSEIRNLPLRVCAAPLSHAFSLEKKLKHNQNVEQ